MANKQIINPVTGQFQLITDPDNAEFNKVSIDGKVLNSALSGSVIS